MKRSLSLAIVLFLFLAGPSKANPVDPVTTQSSLGAGSFDAPDTFGRQHGDTDDSQAIVAETAMKSEMEHIYSNSKLDILEKELSAIPSLAKLFYEAMKQLEESVKLVQKTADDNSEKLKTNTVVGVCAYDYMKYKGTTGTITYDHLFSHTSTDGSIISTNTGKYTVSTQGLYTINFSAYTFGQARIYLVKDGEQQDDTQYFSNQNGKNDGFLHGDQGTRSLVMCLRQGQEIHLEATINTGSIFNLQFCVTLEAETAC